MSMYMDDAIMTNRVTERTWVNIRFVGRCFVLESQPIKNEIMNKSGKIPIGEKKVSVTLSEYTVTPTIRTQYMMVMYQ